MEITPTSPDLLLQSAPSPSLRNVVRGGIVVPLAFSVLGDAHASSYRPITDVHLPEQKTRPDGQTPTGKSLKREYLERDSFAERSTHRAVANSIYWKCTSIWQKPNTVSTGSRTQGPSPPSNKKRKSKRCILVRFNFHLHYLWPKIDVLGRFEGEQSLLQRQKRRFERGRSVRSNHDARLWRRRLLRRAARGRCTRDVKK